MGENDSDSVTLNLGDGLTSIPLLPARDRYGNHVGGVVTIESSAGDADGGVSVTG
jgi:hypothetical protein